MGSINSLINSTGYLIFSWRSINNGFIKAVSVIFIQRWGIMCFKISMLRLGYYFYIVILSVENPSTAFTANQAFRWLSSKAWLSPLSGITGDVMAEDRFYCSICLHACWWRKPDFYRVVTNLEWAKIGNFFQLIYVRWYPVFLQSIMQLWLAMNLWQQMPIESDWLLKSSI